MIKFNIQNVKDISVQKNQKTLKLAGTDGNAFALMGRAQAHNRKHVIYDRATFSLIMKECMSGDYDHLLATLTHFFEVR
jgi:hypothetical protein